MNKAIENLVCFDTPNVGYEDSKTKEAVCGCCGTYFVVSVSEVEKLQEVVSDMYEVLKELLSVTTGNNRKHHSFCYVCYGCGIKAHPDCELCKSIAVERIAAKVLAKVENLNWQV